MDTTLTVGETEYQVVHAEPANRDDIARAGQVKLRLRPAAVDPKKILFSLPTIEDALPERGPAPEGTDALAITPDDYRQVELVPASKRADVDAEIEAVRAVLTGHRKGAGFDEIHVRKRVAEPLAGSHATRAEVEAALGAKGRALALRGQNGVIRGGFAIPHGGSRMVYGVERDGELISLGLHGLYADVVGSRCTRSRWRTASRSSTGARRGCSRRTKRASSSSSPPASPPSRLRLCWNLTRVVWQKSSRVTLRHLFAQRE